MSRIMIYLEKGQEVVPKGHMILVEVETKEKTTESGIVIPGKDMGRARQSNVAKVLAVGPLAGYARGSEDPAHWGSVVGKVVCYEEYEGQCYEYHDGTVVMCIPDSCVFSEIVNKSIEEKK